MTALVESKMGKTKSGLLNNDFHVSQTENTVPKVARLVEITSHLYQPGKVIETLAKLCGSGCYYVLFVLIQHIIFPPIAHLRTT